MQRLLVIYASQEGQTEKIAAQIAAEGVRAGMESRMLAVCDCPDGLDPSAFGAVIAGGPVHRGDFPKTLRDFLVRHHAALNTLPSAFFSVGLSAASENPVEHGGIRQLTERFVTGTGWRPMEIRTFAVLPRRSRYDTLVRRAMRRVAKQKSGDTDIRHDYEYTDWEAVRSFASRFCATATAENKE